MPTYKTLPTFLKVKGLLVRPPSERASCGLVLEAIVSWARFGVLVPTPTSPLLRTVSQSPSPAAAALTIKVPTVSKAALGLESPMPTTAVPGEPTATVMASVPAAPESKNPNRELAPICARNVPELIPKPKSLVAVPSS